MAKEDEMMDSALKMGEDHKEEVQKGSSKILENLFEHGMLPKDALGVGDKNVEKLYAEAYQLYNTGHYLDARRTFASLVLLNATEPKYIFGMGACAHMMKDYKIAADNYMRCAMFDPKDPIPYFHASDCYLEMDDLVSAMITLSIVVKRAGEKPEYKVMKDRSLLTIESIKKETKGNKKSKKKIKLDKDKEPELNE